jgi:hypothetical protein
MLSVLCQGYSQNGTWIWPKAKKEVDKTLIELDKLLTSMSLENFDERKTELLLSRVWEALHRMEDSRALELYQEREEELEIGKVRFGIYIDFFLIFTENSMFWEPRLCLNIFLNDKELTRFCLKNRMLSNAKLFLSYFENEIRVLINENKS